MIRSTLYDYAFRFVGLPYRWGGDDAIAGFDCSGYVVELLRAAGLVGNREDMTAQGLYHRFASHPINHMTCERSPFGALAFYGRGPGEITHVAFCIDRHTMLEAGGGGKATTTRDAAERDNAYVRVRSILSRTDLVAVVMPPYQWETPG